MPKKIPLAEMRDWLEAHERGKSIPSIARDARRDVRTVKRGIEQARRDREGQIARSGLLKEALKKHQDSLLGIIDTILSALVMPDPSLELRDGRGKNPQPIPIPGGTASYVGERKWIVSLHVETNTAWELLQEHLRRDSVWSAFDGWKKMLATHLEDRRVLKSKAATLLEEKTGYGLVDKLDNDPAILYSAVDLFYRVELNKALGIPDETNLEERIIADIAAGEIRHGSMGSILAKAPGAEEECKAGILEAFRELQESFEFSRVKETYEMLEGVTAKARRAVEEISLLGLVPGQCRVCRRLGI